MKVQVRVLRAAVMLGIALLGCSNPTNTVRIKYQHHVSAGTALDLSNNVIPTPSGTYWALFHIVCLANDDAQPQTFHFSHLKLTTTDPTETIQNPANDLVGLTSTITLQPGQRIAFPGSVIMRMSGPYGGMQARYLLYAQSGQEHVLMEKDNFPNGAGPTMYLATLPSPAYPPGADPCEDLPVQTPH